jgi:polar amino acid transport system substrate-binding protein
MTYQFTPRPSLLNSTSLLFISVIFTSLFSASSLFAQQVVIGAEDDWYPYSAKRNGQPEGMAVDLVKAIFAASNTELKLVSLPYTRCMSETRKGEIAGCFDTLRNPLLEKQYLWHDKPLFNAHIVIYGKSQSTDSNLTIANLKGKKVATTNGYDYGEAFDGSNDIAKDQGPMDINGLRKLAQGKVDYAVIYDRNAISLINENKELQGQIKPVGTLIKPEIYLSFSNDYPNIKNIINSFNNGMKIITENGTYDAIIKKWEDR